MENKINNCNTVIINVDIDKFANNEANFKFCFNSKEIIKMIFEDLKKYEKLEDYLNKIKKDKVIL